jgi:uncharacterized protein
VVQRPTPRVFDRGPAPRPPVEPVPTDVAAFVGTAARGLVDEPIVVGSWREFSALFGGAAPGCGLPYAVSDFLANGGRRAVVLRVPGTGAVTADALVRRADEGLHALERALPFGVLALPPAEGDVDPAAAAAAYEWCVAQRVMLLLDGPTGWASPEDVPDRPGSAVGASGPDVAVYWPRLRQSDPLNPGSQRLRSVVGAVAGVIARNDRRHGPWKAPAGRDGTVVGVDGLATTVDQATVGRLSRRGVNTLRAFPGLGVQVWGARTLSEDPEWRYLPVRRLALLVEESLRRGLAWAVFAAADEGTWSAVRSLSTDFLVDLWRRGAFPGATPSEAFWVRCGRDTMTQADIAAGRLTLVVGLAPLRPAEFTTLRLQLGPVY